ncbi:hypothetical protein GE09DRAFT_1219060 [Coniochaeta sp. 2T2.1]|nr:hypothetical protein GE09DRAFT_1219060 [Coniochaeta sp. 2T2.1]
MIEYMRSLDLTLNRTHYGDVAKYVTGDALVYVYIVTLCLNIINSRMPEGYSPLTPEKWIVSASNKIVIFREGAISQRGFAKSDYRDDLLADLSDLGKRFFKANTYMVTEEGYIGIGPPGIEPGLLHRPYAVLALSCSVSCQTGPELVGESFVYGLHSAIPLLGPLPAGWRVVLYDDPKTYWRFMYRFVSANNDPIIAEDPRLEPHPEWERVELEDLGRDLTGDDPEVCDFFRHKTTGELIDYDPRMSAEALEARGVPLRRFAIV